MADHTPPTDAEVDEWERGIEGKSVGFWKARARLGAHEIRRLRAELASMRSDHYAEMAEAQADLRAEGDRRQSLELGYD